LDSVGGSGFLSGEKREEPGKGPDEHISGFSGIV